MVITESVCEPTAVCGERWRRATRKKKKKEIRRRCSRDDTVSLSLLSDVSAGDQGLDIKLGCGGVETKLVNAVKEELQHTCPLSSVVRQRISRPLHSEPAKELNVPGSALQDAWTGR